MVRDSETVVTIVNTLYNRRYVYDDYIVNVEKVSDCTVRHIFLENITSLYNKLYIKEIQKHC